MRRGHECTAAGAAGGSAAPASEIGRSSEASAPKAIGSPAAQTQTVRKAGWVSGTILQGRARHWSKSVQSPHQHRLGGRVDRECLAVRPLRSRHGCQSKTRPPVTARPRGRRTLGRAPDSGRQQARPKGVDTCHGLIRSCSSAMNAGTSKLRVRGNSQEASDWRARSQRGSQSRKTEGVAAAGTVRTPLRYSRTGAKDCKLA